MPEITKDTIIGDLLKVMPQSAAVLQNCGMHCVYCPASLNESIEQALSLIHISGDTALHFQQKLAEGEGISEPGIHVAEECAVAYGGHCGSGEFGQISLFQIGVGGTERGNKGEHGKQEQEEEENGVGTLIGSAFQEPHVFRVIGVLLKPVISLSVEQCRTLLLDIFDQAQQRLK